MTRPGSGPQGVYNQLNTTPPQAPPPGSGLIQGATAAPPPPGPPPNYGELGAGQAQADFAAASSNGGWEFDSEAMDKVIKSLEDCIENNFSSAMREASYLTGIDAMGDEVASQGYVKIANESGASYQNFLDGARKFTRAYADKLVEIKTAYEKQDQAAIDALRSVGKAL
ncbi:hypothetical protein ACFWMR_09460 [Amycolatopsis thailandensis]|uniref:PE domain-containing protein n=1 Tax=Amycolatopsis thailandensis TaxID=589330 RepID=A0A229SHM8_9PSEU|nr:hypothetical protein [Amycolatopsis thailandensis]OXM58259.1 hypothetical protein CFP71_04465 [Amycolatopsis thailandensis]